MVPPSVWASSRGRRLGRKGAATDAFSWGRGRAAGLRAYFDSSFRPRRMSFAVSAASPSSRIATAIACDAGPGW